MATKDLVIWLDSKSASYNFNNYEEDTLQDFLKDAVDRGTPATTSAERKQNAVNFVENNSDEWKELSNKFGSIKKDVDNRNRKYSRDLEKEIDNVNTVKEVVDVKVDRTYKQNTRRAIANNKRARISFIETDERTTRKQMDREIERFAEDLVTVSQGKTSKGDALSEATEVIERKFERRKALGI